jgi:hypothetical protein
VKGYLHEQRNSCRAASCETVWIDPIQGCQIFLAKLYQSGEICQIATKLPNCHQICQMAVIFSKWPSNLFHSKALQNWNFLFENIPSVNPDLIFGCTATEFRCCVNGPSKSQLCICMFFLSLYLCISPCQILLHCSVRRWGRGLASRAAPRHAVVDFMKPFRSKLTRKA